MNTDEVTKEASLEVGEQGGRVQLRGDLLQTAPELRPACGNTQPYPHFSAANQNQSLGSQPPSQSLGFLEGSEVLSQELRK